MTISVISATDDNYVQHYGVMLCSLFKNKKSNTEVNVYLIDGGISNKNRTTLSVLERRFNFKITYLKINSNLYSNFPTNRKGYQTVGVDNAEHLNLLHWPIPIYYRISIPDLVSINLEMILYLNADIIINGDLTDLWNINISDNYLAAVQNLFTDYARSVIFKTDARPSYYFNSGVLLLNLKM